MGDKSPRNNSKTKKQKAGKKSLVEKQVTVGNAKEKVGQQPTNRT
jgi:hypothetical protein